MMAWQQHQWYLTTYMMAWQQSQWYITTYMMSWQQSQWYLTTYMMSWHQSQWYLTTYMMAWHQSQWPHVWWPSIGVVDVFLSYDMYNSLALKPVMSSFSCYMDDEASDLPFHATYMINLPGMAPSYTIWPIAINYQFTLILVNEAKDSLFLSYQTYAEVLKSSFHTISIINRYQNWWVNMLVLGLNVGQIYESLSRHVGAWMKCRSHMNHWVDILMLGQNEVTYMNH